MARTQRGRPLASGSSADAAFPPDKPLRSTPLPPRIVSRLLSTLALAGLVAVVACGDDALDLGLEANDTPADATGGGSPPPSYSSSDAASSGPTKETVGSPLCGITDDAGLRCYPDDDIASSGTEVDTCAPPLDAGLPGLDANVVTAGCRLGARDGTYAPTCSTADARGVDGVTCTTGSDCARGYDCVVGAKGSACRRYCCSGSCSAAVSQNGGTTFCDVQTLVDFPDHKAPVCMPLKSCTLLAKDDCGASETCAVVTEKGETGCVPVGPAKADEACDTNHCARNLTCLGSVGDRRCYELCRIDGNDCDPTKKCVTGSVFKDTAFGVCRND